MTHRQLNWMRTVLFWVLISVYLLDSLAALWVTVFGSGAVSPHERALLIKIVIGQSVGAAVTLFYVLLGLRKGAQSVTSDLTVDSRNIPASR